MNAFPNNIPIIPPRGVNVPKKTIDERFAIWIRANPHVYWECVRLAKEAKAAGHDRWGIKAIIEIIRWNSAIVTRSRDFKLNNDFAPLLTRMIEFHNPDLVGFFETRRRRTP